MAALLLVGAAFASVSIVIGVAMIFPPAAWIVAGVFGLAITAICDLARTTTTEKTP